MQNTHFRMYRDGCSYTTEELCHRILKNLRHNNSFNTKPNVVLLNLYKSTKQKNWYSLLSLTKIGVFAWTITSCRQEHLLVVSAVGHHVEWLGPTDLGLVWSGSHCWLHPNWRHWSDGQLTLPMSDDVDDLGHSLAQHASSQVSACTEMAVHALCCTDNTMWYIYWLCVTQYMD